MVGSLAENLYFLLRPMNSYRKQKQHSLANNRLRNSDVLMQTDFQPKKFPH